MQFPLSSITKPVLIENIFYKFDSAELTDSSTVALDELVRLLTDNPGTVIELGAHCDYKGRDEYNEYLSERYCATGSSFSGASVRDTLTVLPMPSESRADMPTADLIRPASPFPASVTPR